MALKDWKRNNKFLGSEEFEIIQFSNKKKNLDLRISRRSGISSSKKYYRTLKGYLWSVDFSIHSHDLSSPEFPDFSDEEKYFKTKSEALKFAKEYMRRN